MSLFIWIYLISSVIRQSFFYFQNNPKHLDSSYKTNLDLWECLGRVVICSHSTEGKTLSCSRINMVYSLQIQIFRGLLAKVCA